MDGAGDFVAAERGDDALDLSPVTESRDIAVVAAALGARRGLEPGIVAEALDQFGGVGQSHSAMDEGAIHDSIPTPMAVSRLRTIVVNAALAIFAMVWRRFVCHGHAMPNSTRAGGCFLTLFILLGFLYGLSIRNPLKGVLIGLGIGAVLAIATWLIDRRRR